MKPNYKAGFAVLLGLVTGRVVFYFADWSYNFFREPFELWKVVLEIGVPGAAAVIWLFILKVAFSSGSK